MVATTDADGDGRLDVELGTLQKYGGVPVIFFPRTFSEAFKWSGPLASWVSAHVGGFDVVHIHAMFSHSSVVSAHACHRTGVPYLVRPLGQLDPWSLGHHRLRKQLLLRCGAASMLQRASAIHYTTEAERSLAEQQLPWLPNGLVVPLGIDDDWFAQRGDQAPVDRYVLAMARLHEKKGFDLLIDAFHALAESNRCADWALVIAGDGTPNEVERLKKRAASGAARTRISFRGWVSGADRLSLVAGAALFALPSHQENFGLAVAEAMATGVPALVSPEVNLASLIERAQAGWVVVRDLAAWVGALSAALEDPADREQRGRRARSAAERFRWAVVGRELSDMYDGLLRRHPAPLRVSSQRTSPGRVIPAGRAER